MNEQQKAEATKILSEMMAVCATMGVTPNEQEVPGFLVRMTGEQFVQSLADLAEIVGGTELRNEALLAAAQNMTEMEKMLGAVTAN